MKGYRYQPHDFVEHQIDPADPVLRRFAELAKGHGLSEQKFNSVVSGLLPSIAKAKSLDELEEIARPVLQGLDLDAGVVDKITSSVREGFELALDGQEVPEVYPRERLEELQDWLAQAEEAGKLTPQEVDALIDQGLAGFAGLERIEAMRAHLDEGADHPGPQFGTAGRTWAGNTSGDPSNPFEEEEP